MSYKYFIYLIVVLFTSCSEQPSSPEAEQPTDIDKMENQVHTTEEPSSRLQATSCSDCLLIIGGTPSLSPKLDIDSLYSSRLQALLNNQLTVLNAAVIMESPDLLAERLKKLPPHQLVYLLIEIGYDEALSEKPEQLFNEKMEVLMAFAKKGEGPEKIIMIPTKDNPDWLRVLNEQADGFPSISIVQPTGQEFSNNEWHKKLADSIASLIISDR